MRKKIGVLFMTAVMTLPMLSCGEVNAKEENNQATEINSNFSADSEQDSEQIEENTDVTDTEQITFSSLDELNEIVTQDLDDRINTLNEEYEKIKAEIDSYEKYVADQDRIEMFYENIYLETEEMCIAIREYCLDYANFIMEMKGGRDDKYDDLEELYDIVYDDGGEKIYDEIYDGILDDIYDVFYDGILDEAYDTAEYEEWLDACSDEYEFWLDARSDVYEEWLDARSDIYEFWLDMRSEVWNADYEKATEVIQDFQEDIDKLKK